MYNFILDWFSDRFYINTVGTNQVIIKLYTFKLEDDIRLLYRMKQCTPFQFYMFYWFGINLLVDEKFKWFKTCWKNKRWLKWLLK